MCVSAEEEGASLLRCSRDSKIPTKAVYSKCLDTDGKWDVTESGAGSMDAWMDG